MIIAIDFDGTLVEHKYPSIGAEIPGAFDTLKELQEGGHKLILWTMRSDGRPDGRPNPLTEAVEFCRDRGIEFWAVNENPEQSEWTGSPKVYAHAYIDDAAYGCPLRASINPRGRSSVDWGRVKAAHFFDGEQE